MPLFSSMKHALAMVKPWCIYNAPQIFESLEGVATRLSTFDGLRLTPDALQILCYTQKEESSREAMIRDMLGRKVAVAVYEVSNYAALTARKDVLCQQFSHDIISHHQYMRTALHTSESIHEFSLDWQAMKSFFDSRILR